MSEDIILEKGITVAEYKLETLLGTGTYGEVWKSIKDGTDQVYAIKFLRECEEVDTIRFETEAKLMHEIKGKNIPEFYTEGLYKGLKYIVIEFIEGDTIEEAVEFDGLFSEKEIALFLLGLSKTLKKIWDSFQMMHRDIKPENIIIKEDRTPILMDFGIAKIAGVTPDLTMTGTVVGTPVFMSPEQALGEKESIDCRTDIYSLGATAYFMAIGLNPKKTASMTEIVKKIIFSSYPSITEKAPNFSPYLASIIRKMTRRDLKKRYKNWGAVVKDLEKYLGSSNPQIKVDLDESQFLTMDDFEPAEQIKEKVFSTKQIILLIIITTILIAITLYI